VKEKKKRLLKLRGGMTGTAQLRQSFLRGLSTKGGCESPRQHTSRALGREEGVLNWTLETNCSLRFKTTTTHPLRGPTKGGHKRIAIKRARGEGSSLLSFCGRLREKKKKNNHSASASSSLKKNVRFERRGLDLPGAGGKKETTLDFAREEKSRSTSSWTLG